MAALAERQRQRGSEAATAGSAVTASAARDGGGRDEDNGGDSDGGVHSRQSTKRGSGRDDSGGDGDGSGNSYSDGNGDGERTATLMLKGFLVGTEVCFQRGSYDFLVSVRYVVFGGGRTIFLVWGFALTKEKVVHTTLCTTYLEKKRPKKCRRPSRYVPYKGTFVPYDGTYGAPD